MTIELEQILALVGELKSGSNWLSGRANVYSYNRSPKQAAALLEILAEISIANLLVNLRAPDDWRLEGYGHFKDVTSKVSDAPFRSADVIEAFCHAELRQQLDDKETIIEQLRDSQIDKLLAMTDEQVTALCRIEGSNPDDAARIAKQAMKLAVANIALSEAQARIVELEARGDPEEVIYSTPCEEFEAAIKKFGVVAACEWFGYASDSKFTAATRQHLATTKLPECNSNES